MYHAFGFLQVASASDSSCGGSSSAKCIASFCMKGTFIGDSTHSAFFKLKDRKCKVTMGFCLGEGGGAVTWEWTYSTRTLRQIHPVLSEVVDEILWEGYDTAAEGCVLECGVPGIKSASEHVFAIHPQFSYSNCWP